MCRALAMVSRLVSLSIYLCANVCDLGCPPHGGGAFGIERIVLNWLDLKNVRLATLFPRDPSRVTP